MRQVSTPCAVSAPTSRATVLGPYQKIGEREVIDFLWENIICRFGIPKEIACGNGPQFIGSKVTKFLEDLKIKIITSSPYHLSSNWKAESTNKVIIQNFKKRLEETNGKWPEELPIVLWASWTTTKSSTGETPFSLGLSAHKDSGPKSNEWKSTIIEGPISVISKWETWF
nr:uncharacterized protein LOC117275088 [Nicotiana tomentosiformis]